MLKASKNTNALHYRTGEIGADELEARSESCRRTKRLRCFPRSRVTRSAVAKTCIVGTGGTEGRSITSKLGTKANVNSGADGAAMIVGVIKPDLDES